jgi:hypothetical protein
MKTIVEFEGIDDFNRPVFKSINSKERFGSTDILFPYHATESQVLEKVTEEDLVYFGIYFGCEPYGSDAPDIEIKKIFGSNLDSLKDVTNIIYDTLMKNKNFPQLNLDDVKEQYVDASTGCIYLSFGESSYQIKITKE